MREVWMQVSVYIAFVRSVRGMSKPLEHSVLPLVPSIVDMVGDYKTSEACVAKAVSLQKQFSLQRFVNSKFLLSSISPFTKIGVKRSRDL